MYSAIIGLAGVLLGLIISEYFRRKSRIEIFTKEVFLKRLQIYEELYQILLEAEKKSYALEDEENEVYISDVWSEVIFNASDYLDRNFIFINEEIIVQFMTTLVGYDEILLLENRENKLVEFKRKVKETKLLIRTASGVTATEKMISNVAKIKLATDYINNFRSLKKQYEKSLKKTKN